MSNIQKTLDALQPYVIGIRYLEGTAVVDAVFKEGWTVLDDPNIKKIKGNEELNYFMFYSEAPNIGLDELLNYVKTQDMTKLGDITKYLLDKNMTIDEFANKCYAFDDTESPDMY